LINEEALVQMGIKDPIGHDITMRREIIRKGKIIGVMKNFHLQSLHTPIEPLCLFLDTYPGFGFITVRTEPGKTKQALASMEKANTKFNPTFPFEYTFADEDYKRKYASEVVLSDLAQAFSGLVIFISCLGLFGLAAFNAEQRTKEIGIRKVLGATVTNIVALLSHDFVKLVVIAFILGAPVAWYCVQYWLQGYAYRVDVSAWMFGAAGATAFLIAFVTVSSQALRAAVRNPVESLKSE
jgi:putative ABC transport system permease protein